MRIRHLTRTSDRRRRRDDERGSAIVELAVVALFIFSLTAGAFDYGSAWRASLALNEASRTAARVGSAAGPTRGADFNALSGAKSALVASGRLDDVTRVVVFKSTTANGKVPNACKAGTSSSCHILTGAQFRTNWQESTMEDATNENGCLKVAVGKGWCPLGVPLGTNPRVNVQASAEYYGVWIQMRHQFDFPIVGAGQTIERTTTMRLEPKV